MTINRRDFLKKTGYLSAASIITPGLAKFLKGGAGNPDLFFDISLAQWSLHRSIFGEETMQKGWEYFGRTIRNKNYGELLKGDIDPIEFPTIAKEQFGITAVEYVNTFYMGKAEDQSFLRELKSRSDEAGVENLIIMCDQEGNLGDTDASQRKQAVENHYKWVDAAEFLGCHSIRVNAAGNGSEEEVAEAAASGLSMLSDYAGKKNLNVIVENHGGYSSDASWLVGVIEKVNKDNCGTLPDFGNFQISENRVYDRYKGVREMMPYAKGVSAKTHDFDSDGYETGTDYKKMLQIVKDAGYTGYIGIEYEGNNLSEPEGIKASKELLVKVGKELTEY